jgi:exopolysaccharide biosynthesis polyprenyl glycosylphosphotransferase
VRHDGTGGTAGEAGTVTAMIPVGRDVPAHRLSPASPRGPGLRWLRAPGTSTTPLRTRPRPGFRLLVPLDAAVALVAAVVLAPLGTPAGGLPGPLDAALAALWVGLLASTRAYEARPVPFGREDIRRVLRAGAGLAVTLLAVAALGPVEVDQGRVLALTTATAAAGAAGRWATATLGRVRRATPVARVVVTGHRQSVTRLLAELRTPGSGMSVVGVCLTGRRRDGDFDVPVASGLRNLRTCVEEHSADAVVVIPCRHLDPARLRRIGWELEQAGTHVLVTTGLLEVGAGRTSLGHAGSLPLLHVRHADLRGAKRVVKELWERTVAGILLLLLAPTLLGLALAVRLESTGPALFRQTRIGKDGTPFTMLKLRTMSTDAEVRLRELTDPEQVGPALFKMRHDPRVTRLGRFLRRFSLDELPQLVNVVRGDMALVGPRPPLPSEVERYDADTWRRLAVTPGLTGLWQVSGRSDLSWDESVRLDLRYVENWSIALDLRILCRTVRAVLSHRGAY